jgi:aspartate racemase
MHIGLIGGIGPAATEFYYRHLARAHAAAGRPLDLTIVTAEVSDLARNMADSAPERQAAIFARLTERLKLAGAQAVALTSIGGHFCLGPFARLSVLPILSIIPALDAEFARRGLHRVGMLGTRVAMASRIYGGITSAELVVPEGDDFEAVHEAYVSLATADAATDARRALLFRVGQDLCRRRGAEAVPLAGTDLFVAFEGHDCGFPTIDGAMVHVQAIARASME